MLARDGDQVIIKTSLTAGQAPFSLDWRFRGEPVQWSGRVVPYSRPGCVGISLTSVGPQDEGTYTCTISNTHGEANFSCTLLVDCKFAESGC